MKNKKLPQEIVVTLDNEGTKDEFLNAHFNAHEATEHGVIKRAGVYVLKEFITVEGITKVTPGK